MTGLRPRLEPGTRLRVVRWKTLEEKAKWLDGAASLDATERFVRDFAQRRFLMWPTAEGRARAIQHYVRDELAYVHDFRGTIMQPGEEFADSEDIIKRGYDDCDGKSRAFVALCRVLGIDARIRPIFKEHPHRFVHVQAEVRWPGSSSDPRSGPGGWLLAECILQNVEIGDDPMRQPKVDGRHPIANDHSYDWAPLVGRRR